MNYNYTQVELTALSNSHDKELITVKDIKGNVKTLPKDFVEKWNNIVETLTAVKQYPYEIL